MHKINQTEFIQCNIKHFSLIYKEEHEVLRVSFGAESHQRLDNSLVNNREPTEDNRISGSE